MKIGELSKKTDCSIQTIRYYEKEGLFNPPLRSEGNFRLYNDEAVKELNFILRCRSLDISLAEIRQLKDLKYKPIENCQDVNLIFDKHIRQVHLKMKELRALKKQLKLFRDKCTDKKIIKTCGIIKELTK